MEIKFKDYKKLHWQLFTEVGKEPREGVNSSAYALNHTYFILCLKEHIHC